MQLELSPSEAAALARCVETIGTSDFPREVSLFCASLCQSDNVYLTALFDDQAPIALYGNHRKPHQTELLELYLEAAYLLDPFYLQFRQKRGDQVLTLDDVAPDNFKQSEYHARFFAGMGLTDECAILLHFDAAALFFSMGTERADRAADARRAALASPIVAALSRRHWTTLTPDNTDGSGRLGAHLQAAFAAFGTSVLSPRESEITRMILQGHSSKAIALAFDNSPETIKVHRKRIYAKLNVASQGELLSVFLNALTKMPPSSDGDPLRFL